ncbi:MAG TPA: ATP-binding protein [Candidatus Polarisedimenticolaceae bacterium]|nr:ATP-binding protein [Candidatus Polarisedimenticolaceae bacterium]
MRWLHALSLRTKITAAFVLVVLGGAAISVLIGSRIVTGAVLDQARQRTRQGLATARLVCASRQEHVHETVLRAAERFREEGRTGERGALDLLLFLPDGTEATPVLGAALAGNAAMGAESFRGDVVLASAAPARGGAVYGAVRLDPGSPALRELEAVVFGADTSIGRVTVVPAGLSPPPVEHAVTASTALADVRGGAAATLSVSVLELPYLAVRTQMMLTFLLVAAAGVLVVLALTFAITRNMIHPLEQMAAATRRIAQGDFARGVSAPDSEDEIGLLARSFNKMLAAIKAMKEEAEQWSRTLEERVHERTAELARVQAQMAQTEKMASLGSMAAGVAHELNNPMSGILSLSLLALEELPKESPVREDLETISRQALRCRTIVRGLLDFSRQSGGAGAAIDPLPIMEKTLELLAPLLEAQHVRVRTHVSPALPAVRIDPGHLQQILTNLVVNAADAMEGGGELTVSCARGEDEEDVLLRVSDTGTGIPDHVLPYIFDPFFTTKRVGKGTGLGLSIVHGLLHEVGGRIEVTTAPTGTTFAVHLPLGRPEPALAAG